LDIVVPKGHAARARALALYVLVDRIAAYVRAFLALLLRFPNYQATSSGKKAAHLTIGCAQRQ
jgi:hypothetical protein